jgi:hypothetical protein
MPHFLTAAQVKASSCTRKFHSSLVDTQAWRSEKLGCSQDDFSAFDADGTEAIQLEG